MLREDAAAVVLMIEAEFFIESFVLCDPVCFLEVGMEILHMRIEFLELFSDLIDIIGIFPVRDRHDGTEVVIMVLFGIGTGLFHPHPVAAPASLSSFDAVIDLSELFRKGVIVIRRDDQPDGIVVQDAQIFPEGIQSLRIFFIWVDVGIGKEDRDIEILSQILQGIDGTDTAAHMEKQTRTSADLFHFLLMETVIVHTSML